MFAAVTGWWPSPSQFRVYVEVSATSTLSRSAPICTMVAVLVFRLQAARVRVPLTASLRAILYAARGSTRYLCRQLPRASRRCSLPGFCFAGRLYAVHCSAYAVRHSCRYPHRPLPRALLRRPPARAPFRRSPLRRLFLPVVPTSRPSSPCFRSVLTALMIVVFVHAPMCVCIYLCMHNCICAVVWPRVFACVCIGTYSFICHMCLCLHLCVYVCMCTWFYVLICVYVYMYVHMYVCMCVCVCACLYVCMCSY